MSERAKQGRLGRGAGGGRGGATHRPSGVPGLLAFYTPASASRRLRCLARPRGGCHRGGGAGTHESAGVVSRAHANQSTGQVSVHVCVAGRTVRGACAQSPTRGQARLNILLKLHNILTAHAAMDPLPSRKRCTHPGPFPSSFHPRHTQHTLVRRLPNEPQLEIIYHIL
eukprot:scaffold42294_cov33-Tisochrysis_lutea.AAC.1